MLPNISHTGSELLDADIVNREKAAYMSNEMEDSHLENNSTQLKPQEKTTQTAIEIDNVASTDIADVDVDVDVDAENQHAATHQLVAQSNWQGFEEVMLQKVDPRHYTQVLYESLFMAFIGFIGVSLITIVPGVLSATYVVLIITAALLLMFAIGYLRHRQAQKLAYGVCEHEFLMQKGLWWHKRISLPYSRLQHVSLSQGPLERHFNLFTLKCFSAGSGSAEIELAGIEQHIAEHLRQHLLAQAAKAHSSDFPLVELQSTASEQSLEQIEGSDNSNHGTVDETTVKQTEAPHEQ